MLKILQIRNPGWRIVLMGLALTGHSQDFVNLGLNSADIPAGTTSGSFVPMANAIPGWTGFIGTNQQPSVLYDDLFSGSATLAILDANNPFGISTIPGNNFTVVLQAGFGGPPGYVSASIAQKAVIPPGAQSISFTASFPYSNVTAGWQVTIDGQIIPVTQISTVGSYYGVFEGNISAFAGQDATLEFTALTGSGPTVNLYLDGISFSSSAVPEPCILTMNAVGGFFMSFWRWRNRSR